MSKKTELFRFQKAYHRYSDTVEGVDFRLTPKEVLTTYNVDDDTFQLFVSLPYSRDNTGKILVNESFPDWELLRDLLLALDRLPDSLLVDIYRMEKGRYTQEDLDDLWGDRIYKELKKKSPVTVNLASKEYSRAVEPYLTEEDRFITCVFGSLSEGKKGLQVKVTATKAKAARGMMVRWMAKEQIGDPEDLKEFHEGGYRYAPEYSQKDKLVFL